jgi:hypothetical protein
MCLLYEAGIIAASFISSVKKPEETSADEKPAGAPLTPEQVAQEFATIEKEQNSGGR